MTSNSNKFVQDLLQTYMIALHEQTPTNEENSALLQSEAVFENLVNRDGHIRADRGVSLQNAVFVRG